MTFSHFSMLTIFILRNHLICLTLHRNLVADFLVRFCQLLTTVDLVISYFRFLSRKNIWSFEPELSSLQLHTRFIFIFKFGYQSSLRLAVLLARGVLPASYRPYSEFHLKFHHLIAHRCTFETYLAWTMGHKSVTKKRRLMVTEG